MNIRSYASIRAYLTLMLNLFCLSVAYGQTKNDHIHRHKFALLVNGDTREDSKEAHANNMSRAIRLLSKSGFSEIYLAVPTTYAPPSGRMTIHREKSTRDGVDRLIDKLSTQITPDDELAVYMTGHGGESINSKNQQEAGIVLLNHELYAFSDLAERLRAARFAHRTVMIDTCMAGGGISYFADDDQKTTGITLGAVGEEVSCQRLSPYFWETDESKIDDINHDGKIDLNERFSYMINQAAALNGLRTHPQIVPARQGYTLDGEVVSAPFAPEVAEFEEPERLDGMLGQLRPGQVAVVEYSTDWCSVCIGSKRNGVVLKGYDEQFNEIAKQAGGQFLFVRLKGRNGSEARWPARHHVRSYPTVRLFNHLGQQIDVQRRNAPLADVAAVALYRPEAIVAASVKQLKEIGHSEADEHHRTHALSTLTHLGTIERIVPSPALNRLLLDIIASASYTAAERLHAVEAWRALNPAVNAFVSQSSTISQLLSEARAEKDEEHATAARLLIGLLPVDLLKNLDEQVYQNMLALWADLLTETTGQTHLLAAQGRTMLMYHKFLNVRDEMTQLLVEADTQVGAIMFLGFIFRREVVPELLELAIEFSRRKELSETNRRAIQYRINFALIIYPNQYHEHLAQSNAKKLRSLIKVHLSEMERQLAKFNTSEPATEDGEGDSDEEPSATSNAERAILSWRASDREYGIAEPLVQTVNYSQDWGLMAGYIPKNTKRKSERKWLLGPTFTIGEYEMESRYLPRGMLGIRLLSATSNGVPILFVRHGFVSELGIQTECGPLVLPYVAQPLREDKTWVGGYLSIGGYVEMASALLVRRHPVIAHWISLSASAKVAGLGTSAMVPVIDRPDETRRVGLWSLSGVLHVGLIHVSTAIRKKPVLLGASYALDLPLSETRTGVDKPSAEVASEEPIPVRKVGHALQLAASFGF